MTPSIAIVCDWLVSRGGAERVIKAISDMFPRAPIYTAVYNKKRLPEFADREIITSFIQRLPLAQTKHYAYLPLMPYAFENFDLSKFDIVISSSHSCAKGIITKPQTLHICYCHSPMRYAWDNCHEYFEQFGVPKLLRGRAKKILHELRIWDRLAAERVDAFIANSEHVKRRIWKYYKKEADIIYPPIDTNIFTPSKNKIESQYFLAVGRLTPYKRFDLLVEVFNDLKLPLIIVGTGKDEKNLKKKSGRFITFLGHISDEELKNVYQNSRALVFPQTEDFGIVPLEAMACGIPSIAFADGGALETVIPGKTGLLFFEQTKEALKKAVLEFQAMKWNPNDIRQHSEKFNRKTFENNLKAFVSEKWTNWQR